MIFDLVRLILVSRKQTSLFTVWASEGPDFNREIWLRAVFSNPI